MKKNLRRWAGAAVGAAVSLAFTSCYYDPYSTTTSVGGSYSSGYGDGYGYGGSGFSTSVFVSTGNPQWGYDPYCYSYYDYRRRAYYDPYLNGYYPVGYRPPIVYGVPHPYGWRRGSGYIRPPAYVSGSSIRGYQNRATLYNGTSYGWARQVRQQSAEQGRVVGSRPSTNYSGGNSNKGTKPSSNSYKSKSQPTGNYSSSSRQSTNARGQKQSGTLPSRYNTPVRDSDQKARQAQGNNGSRQQAQRSTASRPPVQSGNGNGNGNGKGKKNADEENNRKSRYR